jgi:predicted acyl esterase
MTRCNFETGFAPGELPQRLVDVSPELERLLTSGDLPPPRFTGSDIKCQTVWVTMRDGIRLATDLYLPPKIPAPVIVARTPYGRRSGRYGHAASFLSLALHGYVVVSQDCRGTGDSEPDTWDCYVYEREDSFDLVEWVIKQEWFEGFLGGCGGSYLAGTQWCMALHPKVSTIAPEVGGLGVLAHSARYHMLLNAYSRSIGKGADKVSLSYGDVERQMLAETLATGYFNDPLHTAFSQALLEHYPQLRRLPTSEAKRWLWKQYTALPPAQRAELIKQVVGDHHITLAELEALPNIFGHHIALDAHMYAYAQPAELTRALGAPALMITGWYDWFLDDTLATWEQLTRKAPADVSARSRLLITPAAHNVPGYHEDAAVHPELHRTFRTSDILGLLLCWYGAVRKGTTESWPTVIYYLMGANEWRVAPAWPPPEARELVLYLGPVGTLRSQPERSVPDSYIYDPNDPTPTLGGSILSTVYTPGSVDVSEIQKRPDVLTYTTEPLSQDLDVVGPLRLILYASSSAVDTDFAARLSDVFPDGRAIQLQNGMLRARFRNFESDPELLEVGRIYKFEIDMWATANRFKAGHRLRLDISSADFPRFDRNTNRGGELGEPIPAHQEVWFDPEHPSHLILSVLDTHRPVRT